MSIWTTQTTERIGAPRLQFDGREGVFTLVDRERASDGSFTDMKRELAVGAHIALDFCSLKTGPIRFSTRPDFSKLRPYGQPQLEADGEEYKEGFRINVYLGRTLGVRAWSNNAVATQNVMRNKLDDFMFSVEATHDKIPVYQIEDSLSLYNEATNSTYYAPELVLIGWMGRDPNTFGTPLVPGPKPRISPPQQASPAPAARTLPPAVPSAPAQPAAQSAADSAWFEPTARPARTALPPRQRTSSRADPPSVRDDLNDEIPF